MKRREKLLTFLAIAVLATLLLVRIVPAVVEYYRQGQLEIAQMQDRILRFENLAGATEQWEERAALKKAEIAELETWVFKGSDPNLVGNSVQRSLRQAVEQTGVSVREMSVARFSYVDDWLLVTQEMSFSLDQKHILPFLAALRDLRPRLFVQTFTVAKNRRQFTGNITVVGFGDVQP